MAELKIIVAESEDKVIDSMIDTPGITLAWEDVENALRLDLAGPSVEESERKAFCDAIRYFAKEHDDDVTVIVRETEWLDDVVREMYEHGVSIVYVPFPNYCGETIDVPVPCRVVIRW